MQNFEFATAKVNFCIQIDAWDGCKSWKCKILAFNCWHVKCVVLLSVCLPACLYGVVWCGEVGCIWLNANFVEKFVGHLAKGAAVAKCNQVKVQRL